MSIYCVGDLHGRFDLFTKLMEKIDFDPSQDKLYLLGDVIDWKQGGIQIINYVMEHQDSCFLIRGNHENQFLDMVSAYDVIMFNPEIRQVVIDAVNVYSKTLFSQISDVFSSRIVNAKKAAFYTPPAIKKWLVGGTLRVRQQILDTMVNLVDQIQYDEKKYELISWVLVNLDGRYKTKPFVKELLMQSEEKYREIKEFIKQTPKMLSFTYGGRGFYLTHSRTCINPLVSGYIMHPHANSLNTTYIFGHEPVPKYHKKIQERSINFDFDYRQIFSWVDANNNRYYNLDLSSNPIAALKLDDMSEYYEGDPPVKRNSASWVVPENVLPAPGTTIRNVEYAQFNKVSFGRVNARKYAFVTLNNGCYEFLIGISKYSKRIYYTRISWLDYSVIFEVNNWLDRQSVEEVVEKVRSDFEIQRKTSLGQCIENELQGIQPNVD